MNDEINNEHGVKDAYDGCKKIEMIIAKPPQYQLDHTNRLEYTIPIAGAPSSVHRQRT